MSQQLPPLNALRAFEAVARHRSFTKAAAELNVTRAAISHQIKYLEDYLGFDLLERKNRSILLTRVAEIALPKLRMAFDQLAEAVRLLRGEKQTHRLTVWAAPSFASKWLVPRLHRFSRKHPEIDMQISGNTNLVDVDNQPEQGEMDAWFRQHDVDVVIRFGTGHYSGCRVEKLFPVSAIPLCSPRLLALDQPHPLQKPDDLRFHVLLHDDTEYVGHPTWTRWLEWQGIKGINTYKGLHFNHVALAIDAAVDGQGVLLSLKALAQSDLDAGRLCIPFDMPMPLEQAYYILQPKQAEVNQKAVQAFVAWLQDEAQQQVADASG